MVDGDHDCDVVVDVDDKKAKGKSPHPGFINSTCLSVRHKKDLLPLSPLSSGQAR